MSLTKAIPIAYFITFTCYGTWLHGDVSSVDKYHNIPGTKFLPPNSIRQMSIKKRLIEEPYFLDKIRRAIVLKGIMQACQDRRWRLLAAHVRSNHVHVVVCSVTSPEKIMTTIKSYASCFLNQQELDKNRHHRWTRHGSTKYLWTEIAVEATIHYVIHEQGKRMSVFENKNRLTY